MKTIRATYDDIATRVRITPRHLDGIVRGERTASPQLAFRLEAATGTPKEIWVFGTPAERRAALNLPAQPRRGRPRKTTSEKTP